MSPGVTHCSDPSGCASYLFRSIENETVEIRRKAPCGIVAPLALNLHVIC